jgi:adenylate cyclase
MEGIARSFARHRWASPVMAGAAALGLSLGLWCLSPVIIRNTLRERALDLLPARAVLPGRLVIVDIDRAALQRFGPWPWPRAQFARLMEVVAAQKPAVVGVDILLAGPDRFSARALLAQLPAGIGGTEGEALLARIPDGDAALARALGAGASALGFVLGNDASGAVPPATPVLMRGRLNLPGLWRAEGIVGPDPALAAAAQGFGALAVTADGDGPIRRVPLLVLADGTLRPGLAVEMVRLTQGAGALLVDARGWLQAGDVTAPLGTDAQLRLRQRDPAAWAANTITAGRLLDDPEAASRLSGRIVLVGGSAPELGGLRVTPASPATPSVQIQAEAVATLLAGRPAYRPAWLDLTETACAALLGGLCLLFAAWLRPLPAVLLAVLVCLAWSGAALAAAPELSWLVDPAGPAILALAGFAVAALTRFARDEWRARLLRASFEQHLAPEVVRRIAAQPEALRLRGEMREITALFSDIEGFTDMTERCEPVELVALLDTYFDAATRIVTDHGGMVEKIVGDSVHAVFNAPFDLPDHARRAVESALALLAASERVRASLLGQRLRLGRTRVGIETGLAIVGDVGGSRKLDYTAHGNAMNRAARLEAANKELGSSICIGPGTAARLPPGAVRSIGTISIRGQSLPVEVFAPAGPAT